MAAESIRTPCFHLEFNQITPSKLWTQTRCIPDLNTCCRKLPYLEIEKIFGLLCHFLRSRVLKYFSGPKPCTQLKSTCKTVLDSILNKVIWYMHCGEKSPVNSQLQCFWLKLAKIRYLPPAFLPQILTKSLHSKSYPTQFCKYFSAVYMVLDQKNI